MMMPSKPLLECAAAIAGVVLLAVGLPPAELTAKPLPDQQQQQQQQQPPPQQPTEIVYSLLNPGVRPVLGLPDFTVQGGDAKLQDVGRVLAETLWNDLDYEQEFHMIDRKSTAGIPPATSAETIAYDRWEGFGAHFVVLGVVRPTAAGFDVELQVVGVRGAARGRRDHGASYGPCTLANVRACAHFIADDMHAKLRQLDGVARTKVAFTSDRNAAPMLNRRLANSGDAKEIYIADYDGENETRITANNSLNISPVWGPDTRTLAYVSYVTGFPDIYLTLFDGRAPTRPANGSDRNQHYLPVISPDGQRIAFASSRAGSTDIWVVNRDGSNLRNLTPNTPNSIDTTPTWSPSGDRIAFVSDRTGRKGIYIMRADGLDQQRIYGDMEADRPTWSKLDFIAFSVVGGGAHDIALLDVRDRSVRMLTDGRGANESPSVSPNGRHVVFVTTRWGRAQIATVGIDGKNIRRLTEAGNNGWPNWSPSPSLQSRSK
jgi:TolB protein